jgi:hypothetical protein
MFCVELFLPFRKFVKFPSSGEMMTEAQSAVSPGRASLRPVGESVTETSWLEQQLIDGSTKTVPSVMHHP